MTKAMHGGLALLSALPERFAAAVKLGGLLLRWMPSPGAIAQCSISLQQGTLPALSGQRLSVLLPERLGTGWGVCAFGGALQREAVSTLS